jgi:hypothetical protein
MLAISSLSPVTAISNGSSIVLEGTPPFLVGEGLSVGTFTARLLNGSGKAARIEGIPIRMQIVGKGPGECIGGNDQGETDADGKVVLTPKITCSDFGLKLKAHAADGASLNSGHIAASEATASFDVVPAYACTPTCDKEVGSGTKAKVSAGSGDHILLAVGGLDEFGCEGYAESSATVTFQVTSVSGRTEVRITLANPTKPANKYQVCFSSPESPFVSRSGQAIPKGGSGLLKDCADVDPGDKPCVVDRFKERGDVVVILTAPEGDPRVRI